MKKLLCAALLTASPIAVSAEVNCDKFSELSKLIMSIRQSGVPIEEPLNYWKQRSKEEDGEYYSLLEGLTVIAYTIPVRETLMGKIAEEEKFAMNARISCVPTI